MEIKYINKDYYLSKFELPPNKEITDEQLDKYIEWCSRRINILTGNDIQTKIDKGVIDMNTDTAIVDTIKYSTGQYVKWGLYNGFNFDPAIISASFSGQSANINPNLMESWMIVETQIKENLENVGLMSNVEGGNIKIGPADGEINNPYIAGGPPVDQGQIFQWLVNGWFQVDAPLTIVAKKPNTASKGIILSISGDISSRFGSGELTLDIFLNSGTSDDDKILLTKKNINDNIYIPLNDKITTNINEISNNLIKINANINDISFNMNKIAVVEKKADDNEKAINTINTSKLNTQFDNALIPLINVGKILGVGTNGEIIYIDNGGSGEGKYANRNLSNIIAIATKIANIITKQATKLGDNTASEVIIETIYNTLKINGYGVFVNGNRIDSSMEWKDITTTYDTKNWTQNDVGKQVRITFDMGTDDIKIIATNLMWDKVSQTAMFNFQWLQFGTPTQQYTKIVYYGHWESSTPVEIKMCSNYWLVPEGGGNVNVQGEDLGVKNIIKFEIFENVNVPEPKLTLTIDNYKQYTTWDNIGGLTIDNRVQQISSVFQNGYIPDPTKPTQTEDIFDLTLPNQLEIIEANAFFSAKINSLIIPDSTIVIGDSAFENANILNLTIGNSLISIGDYAFQDSTMGDLSIPNSVVNIGESAFQNAKIKKLRLDLNVKTIGDLAFLSSPLTQLHIGFQVEKIGDLAFSTIVNSPKTKVYLPAKFNSDLEKDRIFVKGNWDQITFILPTLILDNTNYQKYSIYNKDKKQLQILRPVTEISDIFQNGYPDGSGGYLPIEILVFPNTLVKINDEAFNKARLSNLFLPRTLTSIGENAFRETRTRTLTLPDSLTDIGIRAFYNNRNTILDIGTGLKNLGVGAFIFCQATSLVFPNGIKSIGNWCFANAPLTNIVVPNSINTIGGKAFKSVVNASTTTVSLPRRFNKKSTKDSLFDSHWNNITFTWT